MSAPSTFHQIAGTLLKQALLDDIYLCAFAADYFPAVARDFGSNMDRLAKLNLLMLRCRPDHLLHYLEKEYPQVVLSYDLVGLLHERLGEESAVLGFLKYNFPAAYDSTEGVEGLAARVRALRRQVPLYRILRRLLRRRRRRAVAPTDSARSASAPTLRRVLVVSIAISSLFVPLGILYWLSEQARPAPLPLASPWRPQMIRISTGGDALPAASSAALGGGEAAIPDGGVAPEVRTLRSFELAATETTLAQYRAVLNENPTKDRREVQQHEEFDPCPPAPYGENIPVYCVDFYDAVRYTNRLSKLENREPCYLIVGDTVQWPNGYNCDGYRLPTEAEWELAARGGEPPSAQHYAGSEKPDLVAWYEGNSQGFVHAVAVLRPNRLGLFDLSGNLLEWVWDAYHTSARRHGMTSPSELRASASRVLRGGSFLSQASGLLISSRIATTPSDRRSTIGFRIARTVQ